MKIRPIYLSLILTGIFLFLLCFIFTNVIVLETYHVESHSDCFRGAETNDIGTVLMEIRKLDYVKNAWIESSSIVFAGRQLSGKIFHLDGTNTLFTSYGITFGDLPKTLLTEDDIHRDISEIMEKTKL